MALPSGSGGEQDFIATVAVVVDNASLDAAGTQIRSALRKAVEDVKTTPLDQLNDAAKKLSDSLGRAADQESRVSREASAANQSIGAGAKSAEEQAKSVERSAAAFATMGQHVAEVNKNFNLGALGGALGGNFLSTLLSGGSLSSALSASLGQLQPALFQIAQGGEAATAAFAKLGIEGVGAVSGLTSGLAALGVAALAVVPIISAIGNGIQAAYEQQKDFIFNSGLLAKQLGTTAEEGAKLRAALTLTGNENNIFAAITLSQIQASVAAIDRVNRGLDVATPQVEKFASALKSLGVSYQNQNGSLKTFAELVVDISAGLQKLDSAQRSLAIQNLAGLFGGDVAKIFGYGPEGLSSILSNATVVTEAQAKANDELQISLTNLTSAQTQFNITLTNGLTPLETWFNQFKTGALKEADDLLAQILQHVAGINLETKNGSAEEFGKKFIGEGRLADLVNFIFPDEKTLQTKRDNIKAIIAQLQQSLSVLEPGTAGFEATTNSLKGYQEELSRIQQTMREIAGEKLGAKAFAAFDPGEASNAALVKHYKELDDALKAVQADEDAVAKAGEALAKNNAEVAKSFDAQIDALQKTAGAYDSYYTKIGDLSGKIGDIQAKQGKQFSYIGTGTVKDVEKAIVDLRVLEERLSKMGDKGAGIGDPKFDQLLLNITRRRTALGLQPGELTDIKNVDITVGITGLGKADKEKLNELFQQLTKFKQEFLQGGFDVTQSAFGLLADSLKGLAQPDFLNFLSQGASTLQDYATSLGLFASPGFTQAIGEAALQQKLLAGGFGEVKSAEGAAAAFEKYVKAFGDLRSGLFDLSEFIADPSKLGLKTLFQDFAKYEKDPKKVKIPIAIELGLTTAEDVKFAGQDVNALFGQGKTQAAQEVQEAQRKLAALGTGQGITAAFFAKMGVVPGEAIKAGLKMAVDLKVDNSLVDKQLAAQKKLAEDLSRSREINTRWNLHINLTSNLDEVRQYLQSILTALGLPGGTVPAPGGGGTAPSPRRVGGEYTPEASGGDVFRGMPYLVGEEGKPELFIPHTNGRIVPGNDTSALMRMFSGRERLPSQPVINYAPVVQQTLNVDARGTNAREVTNAIKRTQNKGSLFTSSSDLVRNRDFLRARGIN